MNNKDTKIMVHSVTAKSIYCCEHEIKYKSGAGLKTPFYKLGKAVIPQSLFTDFMSKHGCRIVPGEINKDFIIVKFEDSNYSSDIWDYESQENEETKQKESNKKPVITSDELRVLYYENGLNITWEHKNKKGERVPDKDETIHYVYLYRTAGKAKSGSCVFIKDSLYEKAEEFLTMGLSGKIQENVKLVELEAYKALSTGAAIDYITIPFENVLIIKDKKVVCKNRNVIAVKSRETTIKGSRKNNYAKTELEINKRGYTFYEDKLDEHPDWTRISKLPKTLEKHNLLDCLVSDIKPDRKIKEAYVEYNSDEKIENTLFDGQGLVDESIFPEDMKDFIYCRNHFFKACLFRFDIQQWLKDHYKEEYETATVTDLFGNVRRVKDIKVVTTDKAIKWYGKFDDLMSYKEYEDYLKKYGYKFSIVKTGKSSKWGEIQKTAYQPNNTWPTTDEEMLGSVAERSYNYLNGLKKDIQKFYKHLQITANDYNVNETLLEICKKNSAFVNSVYLRKKQQDIVCDFKNYILMGKLFQEGDNLTVCGNPIALMLQAVGEGYEQENCFKVVDNGIQCYTTRFEFGKKLAAYRNPHNSPNNLVHFINTDSEQIKKYMPNLGDTVIIVNGIGTDVQSRCNSMDMDSDSVFATDQKELAELAEQAYLEFPTIVNAVPELTTCEYNNDLKSRADIDNKIKSGQKVIGMSTDIAQVALSLYFHNKDNGQERQDLLEYVIVCAVLSQIAIDSAKRSYDIDMEETVTMMYGKMRHEIKEAGCYPEFFRRVQQQKKQKTDSSKGKKKTKIDNKKNKKFESDCRCPMDILATIIDANVKKQSSVTNIETINFIRDFPEEKINYKQLNAVKAIIENYNVTVDGFNQEKYEKGEYQLLQKFELDRTLRKLKNVTINRKTMSELLKYYLGGGNGIIDRGILVLYRHDQVNHKADEKVFLECFKNSLEEKSEKSSKHKPKNMKRRKGFS